MGNGWGILVGVVFIIFGLIIALITVSFFINQAKLFEFISAFQGYLIGAIVTMIFWVIGGLILIAELKS